MSRKCKTFIYAPKGGMSAAPAVDEQDSHIGADQDVPSDGFFVTVSVPLIVAWASPKSASASQDKLKLPCDTNDAVFDTEAVLLPAAAVLSPECVHVNV